MAGTAVVPCGDGEGSDCVLMAVGDRAAVRTVCLDGSR